MRINVFQTADEMGRDAAGLIAKRLTQAIAARGEARLLLSTGASQFETIDALTHENVNWSRVTMFHLDEYVALPQTHIASFRKYLKERFVQKVNLKEAVFVNGEGDVAANIAALSKRVKESPIDVGVIGIGENGHIAFNDPPVADF
ncbi:MAG: 6-phosphogluconolactonase, partial [Clostridia bacterium]